MAPRNPLTAERIIATAIDLADHDGIDAVVIRTLAKQLGAKPMAIYHHLANKDALLDGVVDAVFAEIYQPDPSRQDWRSEIEQRCRSARETLARHSWAIGLLESRRQPGPATLTHHNAMIGTLREAGFGVADSAHAFALIDSYVFGFAVQETNLPFDGDDEPAKLAAEILSGFPSEQYPYLAEMIEHHILRLGYDFSDEFEIGLAIVLDGVALLGAEPL